MVKETKTKLIISFDNEVDKKDLDAFIKKTIRSCKAELLEHIKECKVEITEAEVTVMAE